MARGKPANHAAAYAAGYCTAKHCRTHLDAGAGNQWVDAKGDLGRYCWPCWVRHNAALETKTEVHRDA